MIYQVLEKPDKWFNNNILGKFFPSDLDGMKEHKDPDEFIEDPLEYED